MTRTALLLVGMLAASLAAADKPPKILPEATADRTFPYLQQAQTFQGTPLAVKALVPRALVVVGEDAGPRMQVQAANIAYMLGQWSQDPGTSLEAVQAGANLAPVALASELSEEQTRSRDIILLGTGNELYGRLADRIEAEGSFIRVVEDGLAPGRSVMVVSDPDAAAYLANRRLYFKSGAYGGFFSFVKVRALIQQGDFAEALYSLSDPEGVRGCGKPVVLAIGHKADLPDKMMQVAKQRNRLVFKELRAALKAEDKKRAVEVWHETMKTCYACHQGSEDVPRYRQFVPDAGVHSYHQEVAGALGASCGTCHRGETAVVGYEAGGDT